MNRRTFLKLSAALPAVSARAPACVRSRARSRRNSIRAPGTWRTYEITTRVEVVKPAGVTRVWVPLPVVESEYQKPLGNKWSGNAQGHGAAEPTRSTAPAWCTRSGRRARARRSLEVVSRFQTQDRAVDWSKKTPAKLDAAMIRKWTQPTDLMPTDGIVKETADEATQGKRDGPREGAGDLRLDPRQHVPRAEGARLRRR